MEVIKPKTTEIPTSKKNNKEEAIKIYSTNRSYRRPNEVIHIRTSAIGRFR